MFKSFVQLLDASTSWNAWKSTYFIGLILSILPIALEGFFKPAKKYHRANAKDMKATQ